MNSLIYKASEFQGEIFALSITQTECSSLYFMRRFLTSKTITFLDSDLMNFAVNSPGYHLYNLSLEHKSINQKSGKKLAYKIMYWVGFIYRFLCSYKTMASKRAYHMIKPEEMIELYPSLHTQSPEYVCDYIIDSKNLDSKNIQLIKKIYGLK